MSRLLIDPNNRPGRWYIVQEEADAQLAAPVPRRNRLARKYDLSAHVQVSRQTDLRHLVLAPPPLVPCPFLTIG